MTTESTKATAKFCARQIECILRFIQNVYPNDKLENHLSFAIVLLDEFGYTGAITE